MINTQLTVQENDINNPELLVQSFSRSEHVAVTQSRLLIPYAPQPAGHFPSCSEVFIIFFRPD